MVIIKGKILLLTGIILFASVTVAAYQVTSNNPQLSQSQTPNLQNSPNTNFKDDDTPINEKERSVSLQNQTDTITNSNNKNLNANTKASSKTDVKASDSRSIAQKYIEEPGAVAGKPERTDIGGQSTDVVPVLLNGKRVGEIDIDPKTGKNVGGAGGAP